MNGEEPRPGPVAGRDVVGGPVAGRDMAGGDMAGGDMAGPASGEAGSPSRPLIERAGMASIAAVIALLFGAVAVAAWYGGEGFLAVMAGSGALMTAWAGANTLLRG